MKTLVIDAIIGTGFPTITLALTAEQAGMAEYKAGFFENHHVWRREKLEEQSLESLKTIYEGLRAERELQAQNAVTAEHVVPSAVILPFQAGMH
mgnify:FL=1